MNKNYIVIAIVALILGIAIGAVVGGNNQPQNSPIVGGMTNLDGLTITPVDSGDGLTVGSSGTNVSFIASGTCTLVTGAGGTDESHTASTTEPYDCAVTGAVSGDDVLMQFATSTETTSTVSSGWVIVGAKASTTSGYITANILNFSGGTRAISASGQIASTTTYLILRTP